MNVERYLGYRLKLEKDLHGSIGTGRYPPNHAYFVKIFASSTLRTAEQRDRQNERFSRRRSLYV